eukprot:11200685-Lingulodinium_polyedra.AAC.1
MRENTAYGNARKHAQIACRPVEMRGQVVSNMNCSMFGLSSPVRSMFGEMSECVKHIGGCLARVGIGR